MKPAHRFDPDPSRSERLAYAQSKALSVLDRAHELGMFRAGVTELQLSREIQELGASMFGKFKQWHKRIVRASGNTLLPYREDLTDFIIKDDDILFVDMGPVLDGWEADIGRTFVIGDDENKHRIRKDAIDAWRRGQMHFEENAELITGADLYWFVVSLAQEFGYKYGGPHAGHLIGNFPHERVQGEQITNYIHPDNKTRLVDPDAAGNRRDWILEIHLVDEKRGYGAFFEQWLLSQAPAIESKRN
jgi:Xaa-Pro aminopeptidase